MAILSIMGMYEYDPTIFDDLQVPEGLNRENIINNILLNCAELEVVYSKPEFMKLGIKIWSDSNQIGWKKLYDTMTVKYNPIWNVDADIEESTFGGRTKHGNGADIRIVDLSDLRTDNLKDKRTSDLHDNRTINTHDNETVNLTDTKSVKGFNETDWADAEKNVRAGTDNIAHSGTDNLAHTGTDTIDHTGTERTDHSGTDRHELSSNEQETSNATIKTRRTGNIGVTTTQQMLEQEREIAKFNMIEYITESFKKRFCLMIY